MTTITIPKQIINGKLIAIPERTYAEFLAWQKKVKSLKTFEPSPSLKRSLVRARKNFKKGNYSIVN